MGTKTDRWNKRMMPQLRTEAEIRRYLNRTEVIDWIETLLIAATVMIFFLLFVIQTVVVDGNSMNPTLHEHERLFTAAQFYQVEPRDIVVIRRDHNTPIIKRVIATEGQMVDIDFIQGKVYVDGEEQDEPYIAAPTYNSGGDQGISFPATVPEDCIFVLGDNRNESLDSRYQEIGMVNLDHVFGKVLFRFFPFDKIGLVGD